MAKRIGYEFMIKVYLVHKRVVVKLQVKKTLSLVKADSQCDK